MLLLRGLLLYCTALAAGTANASEIDAAIIAAAGGQRSRPASGASPRAASGGGVDIHEHILV